MSEDKATDATIDDDDPAEAKAAGAADTPPDGELVTGSGDPDASLDLGALLEAVAYRALTETEE